MKPTALPRQKLPVGMHGSCILIETTGAGCAAVGVVVGILINRGIHPV
ncbi:hypothetical protein [Stenotrophomonas sp. ESTM1D_MKCIP4_1]|nr:hypothetical protein [Stenotrophomonas sp. ESTM1D_MKCIP4_1]